MQHKQFVADEGQYDDRGLVKNAVISAWFEAAGKIYLDECHTQGDKACLSQAWQQQSLQFDYLHACQPHPSVELELSVIELGKCSCTLGCRFYQADKLLAVGSSVMVLVSKLDGAVGMIPVATREVLKGEMLGFLRIARS